MTTRAKFIRLQTYEQATARPSVKVWPGCRDGRKRWCGAVHDFSFSRYCDSGGQTELVHNFCCRYNYYHGCPNPKPKPGDKAP